MDFPDFFLNFLHIKMPSVLWHCWLVVGYSSWLLKTWVMKCLQLLFVWNEVQIMICIWYSWCYCHSDRLLLH